jgi:pimeloyl-ACP methyl ester carboxylesterase
MNAGEVRIPVGRVELAGDLLVPEGARGVVVFAHGSGSSRLSTRNRRVAEYLRETGDFGTLLFDLLTPDEDTVYERRFDIELLAGRLSLVTDWLRTQPGIGHLPAGYFGASTGAGAALVAAAGRSDIAAVVSRGGRPDLAGDALPRVSAPTLLIVGGADYQVIELNRMAAARLKCEVEIAIVPGATHLFEERGALEEVSRLARGWFERYVG